MKIAVTGEEKRITELRKGINTSHQVEVFYEGGWNEKINKNFDLAIDLNADDRNSIHPNFFLLAPFTLLCAVKKTVQEMKGANKQSIVAGINSLPFFLSRDLKEISFSEENPGWINVFKALEWKTLHVKDIAGMVSPRILFMIINEACFEFEEQTASRDDIDAGMKLGTAYPFGPFQFAELIGWKNIFETLIKIAESNGGSRYQISPLMKTFF